MSDEFDKLHPVLNQVSNTLIELHQNRKDEASREQLIKLEKLLREQLEKVEEAQKQ